MHCLIFSFKKHTNWPQLCISSSYSCIHGLHCHRGVSGPSSPLSPERGSPGLAEAGGGAWQPRLRGLPVDEGSRARSGRFQVTRPRQLASPGLPPTSCAHPMLPPQGLWPLCAQLRTCGTPCAPPQGRGRRAPHLRGHDTPCAPPRGPWHPVRPTSGPWPPCLDLPVGVLPARSRGAHPVPLFSPQAPAFASPRNLQPEPACPGG